MKSSAVVVALKTEKASRRALICSKCGATAEAACDCGASYERPSERAARAIANSADKSDRAIAADIGVNQSTVTRARRASTDAKAAVEKRVGRDGRARKLPTRKPAPVISDPVREINSFHQEAVAFLTDYSQRFEAWLDRAPLINADGKATLNQAFYLCSDGFARLAQKLDGR
jgi:hypothetical protein